MSSARIAVRVVLLLVPLLLVSCAAPVVGGPRPTSTPVPTLLAPTPDPTMTLLDAALEDRRLATFLALAGGTDVGRLLDEPGAYTLFAPSNEAFAALSLEQRERLAADPALLERVLRHHILRNALPEPELTLAERTMTLDGAELSLHIDIFYETEACCGIDYRRFVDDAELISSPVEASNGYLYVVDAVLWPE